MARQTFSAAVREATLPFAMASAARPYLRDTPEYEVARSERRAKEWLERESMSLGYAMAEVVTMRLETLEP